MSGPADPSPGEQRQPYQDHPLAGPVLNIGRALLNVGSPAHRLEAGMQVMAERLGIKAEFFSTPTVLIASLGDGSRQQTFMARAEPGRASLAKLADLTDVMEQLASGALDPAAANQRVHEIERTPERYRGMIRYFAFLLVAAGISVLFGGGWREMILGGLLGGVTGGLVMAFSGRVDVRHLVTPVAAFLVTLLGTLFARATRRPGSIVHLPGLILLVPGSIGLRSLSALLGDDVLAGLETGMLAALVAVGLSTGMILAGVLVRPRNLL
jgi:uncharacterized membrane protein YjjP (DUF1212 family)